MPPVTESFPDFSGRTIDDGRYLLKECLGSGAYGKVYKALDTTSSVDDPKYYAIKCLLKPKPGSRQEEYQLREFAVHEQVSSHPNVVTFHKVFYDNFFVYVVLDLVDGGDLFGFITDKKVFHRNNGLVKHAFVQILDAVHHCHEQMVFHRDLKPENILCSKEGLRVHVADFGLCTNMAVCQDYGCGSSYYMSPECIGKEFRNGPYSTRENDVWSLGVILTNMISGRNPWRNAMMIDECFAAYLHDKDFLCRVLPITEEASDLLKRIFTLNPASRITIPELRREVLNMDNFFKIEQPSGLHPIYPPRRPVQNRRPRVVDSFEGESTSTEGSSSSSSSDDSNRSPGPVDPARRSSTRPPASKDVTSESDSSGNSGPITPATRPVEPAIVVPSDLQSIGDSIRQHIWPLYRPKVDFKAPRHQGPSAVPGDKPPPRRTPRFLKKAVQKLKAVSSSSSS